MSDLPFKFPIMRIPAPTPQGNRPHPVEIMVDSSQFEVAEKKDIAKQIYVGDLIMDSKGRCWRLTKLLDLGLPGSFMSRLAGHIFGRRDIRYELSDELKLTLAEIKETICAVIVANPESYVGEAAIHSGDLETEEGFKAWLERLLEKIRGAVTPLELIAVIGYNEDVV